MLHLVQPGLAVIVGNAALAVGLVIYGRTRPARRSTRSFELILGVICLALAGLDVAIAVGPGGQLPLLADLSAIPPVDFYISAFCYLVCGGALLLDARPPRSDRNIRGVNGRVKS